MLKLGISLRLTPIGLLIQKQCYVKKIGGVARAIKQMKLASAFLMSVKRILKRMAFAIAVAIERVELMGKAVKRGSAAEKAKHKAAEYRKAYNEIKQNIEIYTDLIANFWDKKEAGVLSEAELKEVDGYKRHLQKNRSELIKMEGLVKHWGNLFNILRDGEYFSAHAILRYLQRVKGFDMEALKNEMCSEGIEEALVSGAKEYSVNGVTYVIQDGYVVTIYPSDGEKAG